MNERDDSLSEDISSLRNEELQRELLETQNKNINSINNNLSRKSLKYNESEKSNDNLKEKMHNNKNEFEINLEIIKDMNPNDNILEKVFLNYIDNEKIEEINMIANENIEKVLSIKYHGMNIIQRCSYLNKFKSLIAIIKQINQKFKGKAKISSLI